MIFNAPNTKRNRIAAMIAIVLGLGAGFYLSISEKIEDDNLYSQLPPEIQRDLDIASLSPEDLKQTAEVEAREITESRKEAEDHLAYVAITKDFPLIETFIEEDFSKELADVVGVKNGMAKNTAIASIYTYFKVNSGSAATVENVNMSSSVSRIVVTREDFSNDGVVAEQFIAMFKTGDDDLAVVFDHGLRVRCVDSLNESSWTTETCSEDRGGK